MKKTPKKISPCKNLSNRPLLVGLGLIVIFGAVWFGIRFLGLLPGKFGEVFRGLSGLASSPVFLEITVFLLGFLIVLTFNALQQRKNKNELVPRDEILCKNTESPVPGNSGFEAVPSLKPFEQEEVMIAAAQGALSLKQYDEALELLLKLDDQTFERTETKKICQKLSKALVDQEDLKSLEARLNKVHKKPQ